MSWFRKKPSHSPWLVVGLGNPGARYAANRHNVGFLAVERWAARHGIELSRKRPWALLGEGTAVIDSQSIRVLVAKPRTFMNLSGDAVGAAVRYYRCEPTDVIVIHDELDFEPGELRLKVGGGHGGHNGLRSIMDHIGRDFTRIRVGIGKPPRGLGSDFVLSRFDKTSRMLVDEALEDIVDAIDTIVLKGVRGAMNTFNSRRTSANEGDST